MNYKSEFIVDFGSKTNAYCDTTTGTSANALTTQQCCEILKTLSWKSKCLNNPVKTTATSRKEVANMMLCRTSIHARAAIREELHRASRGRVYDTNSYIDVLLESDYTRCCRGSDRRCLRDPRFGWLHPLKTSHLRSKQLSHIEASHLLITTTHPNAYIRFKSSKPSMSHLLFRLVRHVFRSGP